MRTLATRAVNSTLTEALSRRRLGALVLSLVLAIGATACNDDDDPLAPDDVTGSYTLTTVDGEPLPAHFTSFEEEVTIDVYVASGTLEVNEDETFTATTNYQFQMDGTPAGGDTAIDSGTYTVDGNDITFFEEEVEEEIQGTINGNRITLTLPEDNGFPESVWVYER